MTALALAAGVAVPLMATLNAQLGGKMGNPFAAAAVLSAVALITCIAAALATGATPARITWPAPYVGYAAGLLFVLYIASITWLAPRMGLGNAIFLVLLGQLFISAAIDHYGLFGAPKVEVSPRRLLGLIVMTAGVVLARRPI
ncbi:MAG: hypothetical protein AcusKO_31700 [Acuticoccus sp.]